MKWIKVEDKLPNQYTQVLVYNEKSVMGVGEFRGKFWVISGRYDFDIGSATHWMPLPEKPKD